MKSHRHHDHESHSAILLLWTIAAIIIPNVWLSITEPYALTQRVANVILPLGVYVLLLSLSRHVGRSVLWTFPIMVLAAFQMVLLYMYGRSVIAIDMFLNVVTTNPEEVSELLGNMLLIICVIVVIFLPPIIMAIIAVVKKWRLSMSHTFMFRKVGFLIVLLGIGFFVAGFYSSRPYRPLRHLFPVNAFYNIGVAVDRTVRVANYHSTSAPFTYQAVQEHPDSVSEVYVLVIGETSRADNWQLHGYHRKNTPSLMNRKGLVAYNRAISQSNTTHKSVPMLLSPLDASNFGDSIYYVKSLITAFKEAGFHTAFFSNQKRNHSFIDMFGNEADTTVFIRDSKPLIGATSYDHELIDYLDSEHLSSGGKHLVVLHTYGSHFSYFDRYPREYAIFTPDGPAEATPFHRNEQLNAYDNTIYYTSQLISDIISRLDSLPGVSAMLYTSDHGEDIYDDERNLFLHASPCPSYYQIHVPFLLWMSDAYRTSHPEIYPAALKNRNKFVASSQAYFHTAMELCGISTPYLQPTLSVVNNDYAPSSPIYLNDYNEAVTLIDAGLQPFDLEKFRKLSISVD